MTNEEAVKILKFEGGYFCDFKGCQEQQAYAMAIKALEQTGWIPVSERLPEEDGFYLATCDGEICGEDEPIVSMAEFENGKWADDEDDYQCVLAWMPLPSSYQEESEDKG